MICIRIYELAKFQNIQLFLSRDTFTADWVETIICLNFTMRDEFIDVTTMCTFFIDYTIFCIYQLLHKELF